MFVLELATIHGSIPHTENITWHQMTLIKYLLKEFMRATFISTSWYLK